ncbi:RNA polymerase sigma factor SigJ [Caenispirillum bisanense]|uniref:RNA polymerase sigma factor SigJ n=1 Tax=Caenispirillum bisanense TaxID=414052 RepID=UPI0031DC9F3D
MPEAAALPVTEAALAAFEPHRRRLWSLAYRMLGTRADADDAVQDCWLRWQRAATEAAEPVRDAEAWLVTACTRLCLDRLKAAPRRHGGYVGPWVPEPAMVETAGDDDAVVPPPERHLERAQEVSLALLLMMERLSPAERAAYVLHELFECGYGRLAAVLGRSETACRQLVSRARRRLGEQAPRFAVDAAAHATLVARFAHALADGDLDGLTALLTAEAEAWNDGGGKVASALNVIVGGRRVARFLCGIQRKFGPYALRPCTANGRPALLICRDGRLHGLLAVEPATVEAAGAGLVIFIRNPDKLPP